MWGLCRTTRPLLRRERRRRCRQEAGQTLPDKRRLYHALEDSTDEEDYHALEEDSTDEEDSTRQEKTLPRSRRLILAIMLTLGGLTEVVWKHSLES